MATGPVTNTNNSSKAANKSDRQGRLPPDERFWKKYSPHYEFPLSLSSSTFLHLVGVALLALIAFVWANRKKESAPLPTEAIVIGGGGGNPNGVGDSPGEGVVPTGK